MVTVNLLRRRTDYKSWREWYDGLGDYEPWGKRNPQVRPNVPRSITLLRPHWWLWRRTWWQNQQPAASLFSQLGGFVSQAGSFPPDTESARAFQKAGGKWLAVQFGDPATDQGNRAAFSQGWAERWRALGVKVGAWWRVEHVGIPVPVTPPVDLLIPNPEQQHELDRLPGILQVCRERHPTQPLAVITLGKVPRFPTGLLELHDAHLIPECFLETAKSDTNVENSLRYWLASTVKPHRLHPCLLFKTGGLPQPPLAVSVAQADALGVKGFSAFTAENTPALSWSVIA